MCGRCDELQRQDEKDARFICELEKRSMSTWSDEELAQYSEITGQADKRPSLDAALTRLSAALGGEYADGHYSDAEMVLEAIRRLESA